MSRLERTRSVETKEKAEVILPGLETLMGTIEELENQISDSESEDEGSSEEEEQEDNQDSKEDTTLEQLDTEITPSAGSDIFDAMFDPVSFNVVFHSQRHISSIDLEMIRGFCKEAAVGARNLAHSLDEKPKDNNQLRWPISEIILHRLVAQQIFGR